MKQVILIGTSHISQESINTIKKTIIEEKPDSVAVELDVNRYHGLLEREKNKGKKQKSGFSIYNIREIGLNGYIFALIGSWLSKKMGRTVGVDPGEDMFSAIKAAQANNIKVALIDQHINVTLSRFSKAFTWREKWHVVADMFKGLISPKKQIEKYGLKNFDLSKVPPDELIEKILYNTKDRYPNLYRVLVHERNVYMIKKIIKLMDGNEINKLVVVVGAGHKKGMLKLLEDQPKANFSILVI